MQVLHLAISLVIPFARQKLARTDMIADDLQIQYNSSKLLKVGSLPLSWR